MIRNDAFSEIAPGTLFRFAPDEGDPVFMKMDARTIRRDDGPIQGPPEIFDAAKVTVYPVRRQPTRSTSKGRSRR